MGTLPFRFPKNDRGWNRLSHSFLKLTIVNSARWMYNPRIFGLEHMPTTGPCFLFANHSNNFDPFALNVKMPKEPTAGVMTRDQFYKPLPALFMDSIGIVPTSKYVPDPSVIRSVIKLLQQQRMIVIFPEGGRRWTGRPKSPIESTMKLFYKMKVPAHPVQIHGSYVGWPRWATYPRRSRQNIHFLKPLHPEEFTDYQSFYDACVKALDFQEERPAPETIPFWAHKPAVGIDMLLYRCPTSGRTGAIQPTEDGWGVQSETDNTFRARMTLASQLRFEGSDPEEPAEILSPWLDKIRELPMFENAHGVLEQDPEAVIYSITPTFERIKLGVGHVWLERERIRFEVGSVKKVLPLEDILALSIEQRRSLSITLASETWQIELHQGYALQWKDYIQRLQKKEPPLRES